MSIKVEKDSLQTKLRKFWLKIDFVKTFGVCWRITEANVMTSLSYKNEEDLIIWSHVVFGTSFTYPAQMDRRLPGTTNNSRGLFLQDVCVSSVPERQDCKELGGPNCDVAVNKSVLSAWAVPWLTFSLHQTILLQVEPFSTLPLAQCCLNASSSAGGSELNIQVLFTMNSC